MPRCRVNNCSVKACYNFKEESRGRDAENG